MTNPIVADIRSKAFWRILVHPLSYSDTNVSSFSALEPIITRSSVRIRGWDFPHISDRDGGIVPNQTFIERVTNWQHYLEYWRFYQSGQFIYLGGVAYEWRERSELWPRGGEPTSGRPLSVTDVIYRFTEAFELASRMSLTEAGADEMRIEIGLNNISGVHLELPSSRAGFMEPTTSGIRDFPYAIDLPRDLLVGDPKYQARRGLSQFFQRFRWDPDDEVLESMQQPSR
jgi:hypothetical protein